MNGGVDEDLEMPAESSIPGDLCEVFLQLGVPLAWKSIDLNFVRKYHPKIPKDPRTILSHTSFVQAKVHWSVGDDADWFGPPDQLFVFAFESFLIKLKFDVRGPSNPAAQIYRRISEASAGSVQPDSLHDTVDDTWMLCFQTLNPPPVYILVTHNAFKLTPKQRCNY
ncbi:hypothetical protein AHF37_00175 [Paragonimus kellicotti]|nr:hypothetical protein AHF37_00175 [Paragonimus kellicotti]